MELNIPDQLPQLAVGSHGRGSGMACIMNAISYLNGDIEISDAPDCTFPLLADAAIGLNDTLCNHRKDGDPVMCQECSHQMWLLGARIIGTAEAVVDWRRWDVNVLHVRLAAWCAEQVLDLVPYPHRETCWTAIVAARTWADNPGHVNALAAQAAARATSSAIKALGADSRGASAWAVHVADSAALAAAKAGAGRAGPHASDAVSMARQAIAANELKLELFHGLIDEFERLTGTRSPGLPEGAYEQVAREAALTK